MTNIRNTMRHGLAAAHRRDACPSLRMRDTLILMPAVVREHVILATLASAVRVLSLQQLASAWWSGGATPQAHARRALRGLVQDGWLASRHVQARPLIPMEAPLFTWAPGEPPPDHEALGYAFQRRWPSPPVRTLVFIATRKTRNRYGGHPRPVLKAAQVTHDLHVGELYLRALLHDPPRAERWVGEDLLGKAGHGRIDPDAVLEHPDSTRTAVEFGGNYDARRVRHFHEGCAVQGMEYELW